MRSQRTFEGFKTGLALVDCLPVLLCSITLAVLTTRFRSALFIVSAVLIILTGALKCLWKFIIAASGKDIQPLFYQMRSLMPLGGILALLSLIVDRRLLSLNALWSQMSRFPNVLFYALGIAGMVAMSWFARHLDSQKARSNWIEQLTNTAAQLCFLLGVLL